MILEESLKDLCVGVKAGGSMITHRPLFSRDAKSIYIVSSNTVLVYSTTTFLCTGRIRTPNAEAIANIALDPGVKSSYSFFGGGGDNTPEVIYILTTNGSLFQLDISKSPVEILMQANLNHSLPDGWKHIGHWLNMLCPKVDTFLVVGVPDQSEEALLYLVTKTEESFERKSKSIFQVDKICWQVIHNVHSVAFGMEGDLVAAVQKTAVFMTDTHTKVTKWHMSGTRNFTCVACHPHEWVVATGDDSGRILVWRNFLEEKSPAKTVYHWHTLPVNDLSFTVDGTHMVSGSGECTLVRWNVTHPHNNRTLPRMGLPIRHVSVGCDDMLIATSHADNCIQLIDPQNEIKGSIQNITQCYIPEDDLNQNVFQTSFGSSTVFQAGLEMDPRNRSLVMNGKPGHLQAYSYREDKHLYTLDITQQNFVTAERQKAIPNSDVCCISFSKQGRWLATAESLLDTPTKCIELRLKFWKFDMTKQIFVLNTSINWPHEIGIVNLKIQPIDDDDLSILAASSGRDKKFKTWGIVTDDSIHGKDEWWSCEDIGTYRDLQAGPLAFSRDGSVLAAPFGHILTLWTCDTHEMKGALCHTRLKEDIRFVEFGCHLSSHLVICSSAENLVVWDVVTLTLLWAVPFKAASICTDPLSNLVAAFSTKNHVYFFRPDSPEPLAHHANISRSKVISAIFVPNPSTAEFGSLKSTLMFLNSSQELCSLAPRSEEFKQPEIVRIKPSMESSTLTPFAQLIAEKSISYVDSSTTRNDFKGGKGGQPGCQIIRDIMDASPHTMPSVTFFCNQLLSAVSTPKSGSDDLNEYIEASKRFKKENKKSKKERKTPLMITSTPNEMEINSKCPTPKPFLPDLDEVLKEDTSWIRSVFKKPSVYLDSD